MPVETLDHLDTLENPVETQEPEQPYPEQLEALSSDILDTIQTPEETKESRKEKLDLLQESIKRDHMLESINALNKRNLATERPKLEKTLQKDPSLKQSVLDQLRKESRNSQEGNKENQIIKFQIYGKLALDSSILIDGIEGTQTRLVKEFLAFDYQTRPLDFINQIDRFIRTGKSSSKLTEKLLTKLLRQAQVVHASRENEWRKFLDTEDQPSYEMGVLLFASLFGEQYDPQHQVRPRHLITAVLGTHQGTAPLKGYDQLVGRIKEKKEKADNKEKDKQDKDKDAKKDRRLAKRPLPKDAFSGPKSLNATSLKDLGGNPSLRRLMHSKNKEERSSQLYALKYLLDEIRYHLDITNPDLINFGDNFNWNPQNSRDLFVGKDHIIFRGIVKGSPAIPLTFSYDMHTGVVSMNSLLGNEDNTFLINATRANTPLFTSKTFDELTAKKVTFSKLKADTLDTGTPFQKELVELNIEKNKMWATLFESFDLNTQSAYHSSNSQGIFHLLNILDNSIRTPRDARLFTQTLNRLNQDIGKKEVHADTLQASTGRMGRRPSMRRRSAPQPHQHTDVEIQTSSSNEMHPLLAKFFSVNKRIADKNQLGTVDDKNNGIYQFLRGFTSNIQPDAPTYFNDSQRLDLTKLQEYLSRIESETEWKKLIVQYDQMTQEEQSHADSWIDVHWPPEPLR